MRLVTIRTLLGVAAPSLLLLGIAGTATPAVAGPPTINCPTASGDTSLIDFDGDGIADAVVAARGANHGAGAIEVRFNRSSRSATFAPGDGVLPAVTGSGPPLTFAAFSINYDACTDLAIGLPTYKVGNATTAGAVQILYGSKSGFVAGPLITPDSSDLPGSAQSGEHFGAALAGENNRLTVGAPGWSPDTGDAATTARAGQAVVMIPAINQDGSLSEYDVFALRKTNPHAGDELGTSVADTVAGAPEARGHGHAAAGCFVWGVSPQSQVTYCGHHSDDRLGQSLSNPLTSSTEPTMAVGSPGHEVTVKIAVKKHGKPTGKQHSKRLRAAGAVEEFTLHRHGPDLSVTRTRVITQASPGVPGKAAAHNQFGYALSTYNGSEQVLAVGIPGLDLPGARNAGAVVVRQGIKASSPWQLVERKTKGVAGPAHGGDRFGASVSLTRRGYPGGSHDYLLYVGVPAEDVTGHANAGRVQVFPNNDDKVAVKKSQLIARSGGAQPGEQYGSAAA